MKHNKSGRRIIARIRVLLLFLGFLKGMTKRPTRHFINNIYWRLSANDGYDNIQALQLAQAKEKFYAIIF